MKKFQFQERTLLDYSDVKKMFEKLKRFWKNFWRDRLPPEPVRKQTNRCPYYHGSSSKIVCIIKKTPELVVNCCEDSNNPCFWRLKYGDKTDSWITETMSRAPKVPPTATHKPMETSPKFNNKLMRNKIPELNKKRQEATLGYGLKSRNFKPRPAYEKRLYDLKKKPEEEGDN